MKRLSSALTCARLTWAVLSLLGVFGVASPTAAGAAPARQGPAENSLSVSVTDARAAAVVAARVHLTTAAGAERVLETDGRGQAYFSGLGLGEYRVEVEADGFEARQS